MSPLVNDGTPALSQAHVRRLLAPFRRRGPDGALLYGREDRRRMYQLLLVTLIPPVRFEGLPRSLQTLTGELSVAAGAGRASGPRETMAALQRYFAKSPPNPQLLADLNSVLKSLVRELEENARRAQPSADDAANRAGLAAPAPASVGVRARPTNAVPALLKAAGVEFVDLSLARHRR